MTGHRRLDWRIWPMVFCALCVVYAIAISAGMFFVGHPQYKSVCISVVAVDGVLLVCFVAWALRRQLHTGRGRTAQGGVGRIGRRPGGGTAAPRA